MAGQSSFPVCYLSASPTGPLLRTLPVIASLITNLPLIVLPLFDRASALPSFVNLGRMSTTVPCGTLVTPEAKLIRDAFAASRVDLCFTKRSALIAHVGRSQTTTRTGTLQPTLPQGRGRRSRMGRMGRGRPGRPAGRGLMLIRIGRASTSEPMPIVSASAALIVPTSILLNAFITISIFATHVFPQTSRCRRSLSRASAAMVVSHTTTRNAAGLAFTPPRIRNAPSFVQ